EIIEDETSKGINEYVGTGPFKFKEWKQNQYVHVTKYDDYKSVDKEPNGHSGSIEAVVENIYCHIVPDTSTRLARLQTGEYHIGYDIPFDMYEQLENDPNMEPFIQSGGNVVVKFNTAEGIASNFELREAINTGLDYQEILEAAFPNDDFYWMYPG